LRTPKPYVYNYTAALKGAAMPLEMELQVHGREFSADEVEITVGFAENREIWISFSGHPIVKVDLDEETNQICISEFDAPGSTREVVSTFRDLPEYVLSEVISHLLKLVPYPIDQIQDVMRAIAADGEPSPEE
jgi:hypothetical protein